MLREFVVRKTLASLVFSCVIAITGSCGRNRQPSVPTKAPSNLTELQSAFALHRQGKLNESLQTVQKVLKDAPQDLDALSLVVELHSQLGQYREAATIAPRIAELDRPKAAQVLIRSFDWNLRSREFAAAEDNLNRAVELAPHHTQVRRTLAQLLNAQGRRYEASEHVYQLIRLRDIQPGEILSLIELRGPFLLVSFEEFDDGSELSLFSLGRAKEQYIRLNGDPNEVLAILEKLSKKFPTSTAVAAFHGRVLAETARFPEFRHWLSNVPDGIQNEPEYWGAVGMWLEHAERYEEAIRAFGETLRRDPTNRESLRSMIRALQYTTAKESIQGLRERLATLDQIFRIAKNADEQQATWISEKLQELARPWESAAWQMHAARLGGRLNESIPRLNGIHTAILAWEQQATTERIQAARLHRMLGFNIEQWALPRIDEKDETVTNVADADVETVLKFEDQAQVAGINIQYHSGFPVDGYDFFPYQVNGGGLAALDFDLDGRCDLYIVQSGGRPNDKFGSSPNQLLRLCPDQQYREVTDQSGTGDRSYGQGACVGDANQDGFPDLLVANIGANVLYLNQGDGTFRDASLSILGNLDNWTSCLALADLTGDHLPEIIEVNYIDDADAYVTKCDRNYLDCQPQRFRKCADRVFRCLADGNYELWPGALNTNANPKLGFGMIIANFDSEQGNDVFIANDGDLNHFWTSVSDTHPIEKSYELIESANIRGCSIGRGGNSQACMGVAAGDFNRDGTLDLHVTNFHNESVNLFLQTSSGYFIDEALKYGLAQPSFSVLGFGTQAADLDNDGWLDLGVLNGHVFNATAEGIPFRMHPQLFRGSKQGFTLQDPMAVGPYWEREQLGRTLATLDWNRDGRMDLVANHLDWPIALLSNQSPSQNWIQFELVGVTCERDAIGAEIRIECGDDQWVAWQTGGDGYMCSNESIVHFGVGESNSVRRVAIKWPSGKTQVHDNIPFNARYLAIQGSDSLFRRW